MRDIAPGDLVLAHSKGLFGWLIRLAESIRWHPQRYWNHAAIVVEVADEKVFVVQMGRRCVRSRLMDVAPGGVIGVRPAPPGIDVRRAVAYAERLVGTDYGILTLFSIALNLLTPRFLHVDFRRADHGQGTLICSALVARAWEHGGWWCPFPDPFQVTPAQLSALDLDTIGPS